MIAASAMWNSHGAFRCHPLPFMPWGARNAAEVAGQTKTRENLTAPLAWETWAPLVAAAWAVVDRFSVDIIAATGANDTTMNRQWARNTSDNINVTTTVHTIDRPGRHTLTFHAVDPTVIVQRLIVDTGGVRYSYLGPPESRRVR